MFERIKLGDVDIHKPHRRVLEGGFRSSRKVTEPGADGDDQIRVCGQQICGGSTGNSHRSDGLRMIRVERAFPPVGLGNGNAGSAGEAGQFTRSLGIDDAAAGDDQWALRGAYPLGSLLQQSTIGARAGDRPNTVFEKLFRIVIRFRLHILRQSQRHGAGLRWGSQYAHRLRQRSENLFRPVDTIPVTRDRAKAIIDGDVLARSRFQLLQHRRNVAPGKDVAGQQQYGDPVDSSQGRAGDHVGRPGPDRRSADQGAQAIAHFGKTGCRVNHGLLIAEQVVGEIRVLLQGLSDAGHIAVAKNAQASAKKRLLPAVPYDGLGLEKLNNGLCHGQSARHSFPLLGSPSEVAYHPTSTITA